MSNFQIYIKLPEYERQWCRHHFGEPCAFPNLSNINSVIKYFLKKRPANAEVETMQDGELAISIPDSQSKDPAYFNFLTKPGKQAIAEAINDIFTKQMFEDLSAIKFRAIPLTLIIRDWMTANGISYDQEHNIIQKYTRIKEAYRKCGVNISRGYKHENIGMNRKKHIKKR